MYCSLGFDSFACIDLCSVYSFVFLCRRCLLVLCSLWLCCFLADWRTVCIAVIVIAGGVVVDASMYSICVCSCWVVYLVHYSIMWCMYRIKIKLNINLKLWLIVVLFVYWFKNGSFDVLYILKFEEADRKYFDCRKMNLKNRTYIKKIKSKMNEVIKWWKLIWNLVF